MDTWGWAGTVGAFLKTEPDMWLASLQDHHRRLFGFGSSESQRKAWVGEGRIMRLALERCQQAAPSDVAEWGIVFEYELPLEGGRRPDVVVLAGRSLVVLEFKSTALPAQGDLDQVHGYVRDLVDYHEASHELQPHAVVVLENAAPGFAGEIDGIVLASEEVLHEYLLNAQSAGHVDLRGWLEADYHPLPMLVDAARRIFRHEPLPHVRNALAAGIPETVELLGRLVDETAAANGRTMAFVTGVPGAGKTLVGLRLVYERAETHGRATFLSGNGPLVAVLQDALQSKVFVRDLHAFIKTYALNQRPKTPLEHVIVFDEAQRAWDARYMNEKKNVPRSEPELLVDIGERIDAWATLVGLVGEGQEIYSGEEAGLDQWRAAAAPPVATKRWVVHCPPRLADAFRGLPVETHEALDLTVSLRSRRAENLHTWVGHVLNGSLPLASRLAERIQSDAYPMYVCRDLKQAVQYVRARFADEPIKRTGLIASSHAKILPKFGVDNGFQATGRLLKVAKWYNASAEDPAAGNALQQVVTEFSCQGLELDVPILCWGEDFRWEDGAWKLTPIRRRYQQDDPDQILRNSYRVLLTRGRDGLVVYLPPDQMLDATEIALLAAGFRLIPDAAEIIARAEAIS